MVAYFDNGHLATEHEHCTHLQQNTERVPNVDGVELLEALGTVSSLEQEGPAHGGLGEPLLQAPCLSCEHKRRQVCKRLLHLCQLLGVRVIWLLEGHLVPPAAC